MYPDSFYKKLLTMKLLKCQSPTLLKKTLLLRDSFIPANDKKKKLMGYWRNTAVLWKLLQWLSIIFMASINSLFGSKSPPLDILFIQDCFSWGPGWPSCRDGKLEAINPKNHHVHDIELTINIHKMCLIVWLDTH